MKKVNYELPKNEGLIKGYSDLLLLKIIDVKEYERYNAPIWNVAEKLADVFGYQSIRFLAINYNGDEKDDIIYHCHKFSKVKDIRSDSNAIYCEMYNEDYLHILIINSDLTIDAIEVTFKMIYR